MNSLMTMALQESIDRLEIISGNTTRTHIELEAIYKKHQDDILTISRLISIANDAKNTSENKIDIIKNLENLMLSKQKDVSEFRKLIDYTESTSTELGKARSWIKGTMETV